MYGIQTSLATLVCILSIVSSGSASAAAEETTVPFFLGDSREDVRESLGTPDRSGKHLTGEEFESYFKQGLSVEYGPNDAVIAFAASWFPGGHFAGKILGVSLGDSRGQYTAVLGEPKSVTQRSSEVSTAVWERAEFRIDLDVWNEGGDLEPWGPFRKGDVKCIHITIGSQPDGASRAGPQIAARASEHPKERRVQAEERVSAVTDTVIWDWYDAKITRMERLLASGSGQPLSGKNVPEEIQISPLRQLLLNEQLQLLRETKRAGNTVIARQSIVVDTLMTLGRVEYAKSLLPANDRHQGTLSVQIESAKNLLKSLGYDKHLLLENDAEKDRKSGPGEEKGAGKAPGKPVWCSE